MRLMPGIEKTRAAHRQRKAGTCAKYCKTTLTQCACFFSRLCSFNLNYCFGVKCQKNGLRLVDALIAACPFDQEAARESLAKTACSEAVDSVGR
jgi:hypothetical protein